MFRKNNRIWCKGLICKASSVASHQTMWCNKIMLKKDIQFHGTFHGLRISNWIAILISENVKLWFLRKYTLTYRSGGRGGQDLDVRSTFRIKFSIYEWPFNKTIKMWKNSSLWEYYRLVIKYLKYFQNLSKALDEVLFKKITPRSTSCYLG